MNNKNFLFQLFAGLLICVNAYSHNPVVQTIYTADPAPMVYNDTLFVFVGRDQEGAPRNAYLMREYRLIATTDMVNWTDMGEVLRTSEISWSVGDASAAQCIERDGKFYFYISTQNNIPGSGGVSVGVMVADNIRGPYIDVLETGLITNQMTTYARHSWDDLDPSVFIDDDGQAYLYWGNGACYWAKLNEDMISLNGPITPLDIRDPSAFCANFTEAPWVYKRNGLYYMIYACGFPESIHYSTAANPEGPWTYRGVIMPVEGGSNTNHPGMIEYKGNNYFFYHNDGLPGGHSYQRSVCVEQFEYNADGTIPAMTMASGIDKGVGTLNPYVRTEAETIAWSQGVKAGQDEETGVFITSIHDGDFIKVRDVDFGNMGANKFTARASSRYLGGSIELRLDSIEGDLIGTIRIPYTGEWDNWVYASTDVNNATGIRDLYMVFKGGQPHELFNFDYWVFSE